MRLRVEVKTSADRIPWPEVLRPGRQVLYEWLQQSAPELGERLHTLGAPPHGMVPVGHGPPVFPRAARKPGAYAAGGLGYVEFGSPLLDIVEAWAKALAHVTVLDWGGVALRVKGTQAVEPPEFASGTAEFRTVTPVVMKGSGRDSDGTRTTRQAWLLPSEPEFPAYFAQSLRRKAETLGLDADVALERITWVGAKRYFADKGGGKIGAPMTAQLRGTPETLRAIWSWGMGQANSGGFGWVTP